MILKGPRALKCPWCGRTLVKKHRGAGWSVVPAHTLPRIDRQCKGSFMRAEKPSVEVVR